MVVLKNIDTMSYAKVYAMLSGLFGVIVGFIVGIISLIFASTFSLIATALSYVYPSVAFLFSLGPMGLIVFPIIFFVLFAILGFIGGILTAIIYDFVANQVGGVVLNLNGSPAVLQSIGVGSYAMLLAVAYAIVIAILGLIFGLYSGSPIAAVIGLVVGAIVGAVVGLLSGVIVGFLYNLIAGWVGGVQLVFDQGKTTLMKIVPWPYARYNMIIEAIFGLIGGLLSVLLYSSIPTSPYGFGAAYTPPNPVTTIVFNVIYSMVLGLIVGFVTALLFNFSTSKVGGVKLTLQ